jgi:chromate transporter
VAISNPYIPKLRKSKWASAFLDSVNVSAVGLMAAVVLKLGYATLVNWQSWVIALAATVAVFTLRKLNSAWLVLGGAVLGYLMSLI